jgi:Rv2525c-like, glycoside hydrolase-like domain/Putative peptidoglycan binding domain/Fibronectin type III domain
MSFGIDYSSGFPGAQALWNAGVTFIARYLSPAPNSKNLTANEVRSCLAAGIDIITVWETTATRMLSGFAAGVSDARTADVMVNGFGMAGIPIYFACDFDATSAQQTAINAYLDGVASVIGRARTGIYGGYWPVKRAKDAGKATWLWQTYAWSGGNKDPRINLYQYSNGRSLAGISVDFDTSMTGDFGQWPRAGVNVKPEDLILQIGDTGDPVKYLQGRLNVWNVAHPPLIIDGVFGQATFDAVKEMQKEHQLTIDGVVGPFTWAELDKTPPVDPPANAFPAPANFSLAGKLVSVGVKWDAVTAPVGGSLPTSYTVQCWQMNGVKVDEQVVTGTSARFDSLVPGWQYKFWVWADGGTVGPPHAELVVTA